MNYKIQIISLIYSFCYGIAFNFFNDLNEKISVKNKIWNIIILFFFIIVNALLYITILYKINFGTFHIYFLFMLMMGFYLANFLKKFISKNVKTCNILKKFKKM